MEQVFKNHGAYGFEAGVWYVLYSPVPLPANKQRRCLDAIFGLSFAELQYLLGDDGLKLLNESGTQWTKILGIDTKISRKTEFLPGSDRKLGGKGKTRYVLAHAPSLTTLEAYLVASDDEDEGDEGCASDADDVPRRSAWCDALLDSCEEEEDAGIPTAEDWELGPADTSDSHSSDSEYVDEGVRSE